MRLQNLGFAVLLQSAVLCAGTSYVVPTTTLSAQTANNTSAASTFTSQTNGNVGAGGVSKVNIHSLLYSGEKTKVYAHLLLWFGGSNHMNVGYNSADPAQVRRQIQDMISRGIDGVIIDWYGPNNSIDQATQLVMAEAENHPGFTFAIMIDQGAIEWDSCTGCTAQQALIQQMQYIEQTYFPSKAYMTLGGRPVVTNFNIDLSYSVDWKAVNAALSTQPVFLFQNNDGFSHVLSGGSYSWVMPTTTDYGMSYLTSFYKTGIPLISEDTVGATYKGFNDTLASWGSNRVMSQQCGQTWLHTFSEINGLYNSGQQLQSVQLVTWNDYEEGTEIESGIDNCFSISASISGNALKWSTKGDTTTVDHYQAFISADGQNLMPMTTMIVGNTSLNLCSFPIPKGNYVLYVKAIGKPSLNNHISGAVKFAANCPTTNVSGTVDFAASPGSLVLASGKSGTTTLSAAPHSGSFDSAIELACGGLPNTLTCSFAPAAITPRNGTATSILTVSAASVASNRSRRRNPALLASLFSFGGFGLFLIGKVPRKSVNIICLCILTVLSIGTSSCSGQPTMPIAANSSSTYSVVVSGTSHASQISTTITVTVQ